jgi:hypothetical protein
MYEGKRGVCADEATDCVAGDDEGGDWIIYCEKGGFPGERYKMLGTFIVARYTLPRNMIGQSAWR